MESLKNKNTTQQEQNNVNPWDTLKNVEYAGDTFEKDNELNKENTTDTETAVQKLRELTDWKAKAKAEDPDGLTKAISADEQENLAKHHEKQEIYNGVKRYQELKAEEEALYQRRSELLTLQNKRSQVFGYRIKQKFGLRDAQMEKWNDELSQIKKRQQESIDLAYSGYAANEDAIQARINAIGNETHVREETFINSFVTPLEKE